MEWRVIELETHDAYTNMAIDHAVSDAVSSGTALPTIRFYKWLPSAVSIGCFQSMDDEVNIEECQRLGVDAVRRRTGGGAVYHDSKGEITYSVIGPLDAFPTGIRDSYAMICGWVIDGLSGLGINAEFAPINDIVASGKKISGNAQTRRDGVLLQHGTVLYDLDVRTMFSVLKISKEKISDKMIKSVEERVTKVRNFTDASQDDLYKALMKGFTEGKDYNVGRLSEGENRSAAHLASTIYCTKPWNFSR
ncbi:MAG: lipoate--protein ligase family protein [Candidatus Micrarchaeota archaeon]|nr:lipoate--protein ligase family protein [Candidatus Micrarchaeota archaeon]